MPSLVTKLGTVYTVQVHHVCKNCIRIEVYLGVPSLPITCASTLQIRYRGHNSTLKTRSCWTKYKIPAGQICKMPAWQIQNASNRELNWLSQAPAYEFPEASVLIEGGRGEILEITERIISKGCCCVSGRWNSRNPLTTEIWKSDDMPTILWPMPCSAPTFSPEKLRHQNQNKARLVLTLEILTACRRDKACHQKRNQPKLCGILTPHCTVVHFLAPRWKGLQPLKSLAPMLCVLGWHCLAASLCVIPALLCVILCYKHPPHYVLYQLYCVTSVVCPPRLEEQLPGSQVSAPDPL